MRVELLAPDAAPVSQARPGATHANSFAALLDDVGRVLDRAQSKEDAFAHHAGSLRDAVYERARADIVLSVATAAAQRTAQALQNILQMQV